MTIILPSEITLPSGTFGSHQHYYHFLLGNLLPLFDYVDNVSDLKDIVLFDPGPFRHILDSLSIRTLDRETYLELTRDLIDSTELNQTRANKKKPSIQLVNMKLYSHVPVCSLVSTRDPHIQCLRLQGFDHPTVYRREKIKSAAAKIMSYLNFSVIETEETENDTIVFINRGATDPFYSSPYSHRKTSGSARRSIPNCSQIISAIERNRYEKYFWKGWTSRSKSRSLEMPKS